MRNPFRLMSEPVRKVGLLAVVTLASPNPSLAASFTPLGDFPGGVFLSEARGISGDGSTVVGVAATAETFSRAFYWNEQEGMVPIGTSPLPLPDWPTDATGSSRDGSVIVGSEGGLPSVWEANGNFRVSGFGAVQRRYSDVSDDGSLIAGMGLTPLGGEAFLFDTATLTGISLGELPGGDHFSTAEAVSADGSIVVGRSTVAGSSAAGTSVHEAFIWDAVNGMVGLGMLAPNAGSEARAVSADGSTVVGGAGGAGRERFPFLWTEALGMFNLGNLPGGRSSGAALGVSGDGSRVVGGSGNRAFVFDRGKGMQALDEILTGMGVDRRGDSPD